MTSFQAMEMFSPNPRPAVAVAKILLDPIRHTGLPKNRTIGLGEYFVRGRTRVPCPAHPAANIISFAIPVMSARATRLRSPH